MNKEKVSIIVPVYNSENTIRKCVDSILNQTYQNIEILLINDGSTDKSLQVISHLNDERIIVIDKKNEGVAKTRNLGIKKATGKYIMFIDNDDFIDKDYIEKYYTSIEEGFDLVIGGYKRVNQDNKIIYSQSIKDYKWSKYIIVSPWARIIKKEFLIKNNIEFLSYKIGEDVYFSLLMYSYNPKIKIIDYTGYNWFFNTASVSNTSQKGLSKDIDVLFLLNKINQIYKETNDYVNYFMFRYYIWYMLFSGKNSSRKDFIEENKRILKWFKDNKIIINIKSFSKKIKGESIKNRLIVFIFDMLNKTGLIRIFSIIYCRR